MFFIYILNFNYKNFIIFVKNNNMIKIPLFITNENKLKLKEMGYDDFLIRHMKPEECFKILNEDLNFKEYLKLLSTRLTIDNVKNLNKIKLSDIFKKDLLKLGYNDDLIKHMTNEEAWNITEGNLLKEDYFINKIYEILNLKKPSKKDIINNYNIYDYDIDNKVLLELMKTFFKN